MTDDCCDEVLLAHFHRIAPDIEVHIQRDEPWMVDSPDYDRCVMTCPHGIKWRMEPTNDQKLRWREAKTP